MEQKKNLQYLTPSFYEMIGGQNYLSALAPALESGIIYIDSRAKKPPFIKMNHDAKKPFVPWIYILKDKRIKCQIWSNIYFDLLKHQMGAPPSGCQSCWKTVVRPRTLLELFRMKDMQAEMDVHSKCGIHLNKDMFGLYQAVFYKRSLDEALEQYKEVRSRVDDKIGKDCDVIVKRGCTKMEKVFPNTKEWAVSPRQQNIEDALDSLIEYKTILTPQNKLINDATMQMWIEEAYKVGDETYKRFTNGKDIGVINFTYHNDLAAEEKENNG